jgi:hypothetical protein
MNPLVALGAACTTALPAAIPTLDPPAADLAVTVAVSDRL